MKMSFNFLRFLYWMFKSIGREWVLLVKKKRNRKTLSTFSASEHNEDNGDPSQNPEKQGYASMYESYKLLFKLAGWWGAQVVSQDKDSHYTVSRFFLVCSVMGLADLIYGLSFYIWYLSIENLPYWYVIMILPTIMGFFYLSHAIFSGVFHRNGLIEYLIALDVIKVKRAVHFYPTMFVMMLFCLFVTLPLCSLIPSSYRGYVLQPLILVTVGPLIQDSFICAFIWTISAGYHSLEDEVRSSHHWTAERVVRLGHQWVCLKELLMFHNSIFRMTTFLRLLLFTAQMMSYLFAITTVQRNENCFSLLFCVILFMLELVVRLTFLCRAGESVYDAHNGLAEAMADELHHPALPARMRASLDIFVTRLEAKPAEIEIWGMGRLGANSMMRQVNIVISFFVLILQIQPKDSNMSAGNMSYFDMCYSAPASDINNLTVV